MAPLGLYDVAAMKTANECIEMSEAIEARRRFDPAFGELAMAWRLVGQWAALDELMAEADDAGHEGPA